MSSATKKEIAAPMPYTISANVIAEVVFVILLSVGKENLSCFHRIAHRHVDGGDDTGVGGGNLRLHLHCFQNQYRLFLHYRLSDGDRDLKHHAVDG